MRETQYLKLSIPDATDVFDEQKFIAEPFQKIDEQLAHNANKRNISVLDYIPTNERNAVINGTSTIDHTVIVQQAVNEVDVLDFSRCKKIVIDGTVTLPQRTIEIIGNGCTIHSQSGLPVFKQTKRGKLTSINGIVFTGNSTAFHYDSDDNSLPNHGQQYEVIIQKCRFLQTGNIPAINLYGTREGAIDNCFFEGNSGILTEFSINTIVSNCHFKNCNYMVRSKLGSEGLIVNNAVALGCSYGIACERTTGVQINNSMIDYCDIPVHLKGATDVLINNNYISTRTSSPAITTLKYDDGFLGHKYLITNNNLRTNSTNGERVVKLEDIYDGLFSNNTLSSYLVSGIEYGNLTNFIFSDNIIRHRGSGGIASVQNLVSGDSNTVFFKFNNVTRPINRTSAILFRNSGFITQRNGEAVLASGATSVVVPHGLAVTPLKTEIMLTPTTPNTRDLNYFISEVTATTFTITTNPAASGTTAFAWVKI